VLKKIDIYIIKKFLGTFFFIIGIFILITIVFDVSEKIDDFLGNNAPVEAIIFDYYCTFIPWLYSILSALIIFLAVIFFTSKLASTNEIVAILSSGISYQRFLRPYFIASLLLFAISLFTNHFVIPISNKTKLEFENRYYRDDQNIDVGSNIHRILSPGVDMYISNYGKNTNTGYNFSIRKMENGELKSMFSADRICWDTLKGKWIAKTWRERTLNGVEEKEIRGDSKDTIFPFSPEDFSSKPSSIQTMNYFEISRFIDEEEKKGSNLVKRFRLELHKRTAIPFSILILTIIGACISSRKIKGGLGMHLVYGIGLGLVYVFLSRVGEVFATNSSLSPIVAVWLPNMFFAFIAFFIYKNAPK
jgi:lipopolysaccharide export system permease protein